MIEDPRQPPEESLTAAEENLMVLAEDCMDDDYPSDEFLDYLAEIQVTTIAMARTVLKTVISLWRWPHLASHDINADEYILHTGGWSGHESIINALQKNELFWFLCWKSSHRGGHYVFDLKFLPNE
jgi:hypothetical protein